MDDHHRTGTDDTVGSARGRLEGCPSGYADLGELLNRHGRRCNRGGDHPRPAGPGNTRGAQHARPEPARGPARSHPAGRHHLPALSGQDRHRYRSSTAPRRRHRDVHDRGDVARSPCRRACRETRRGRDHRARVSAGPDGCRRADLDGGGAGRTRLPPSVRAAGRRRSARRSTSTPPQLSRRAEGGWRWSSSTPR